MLKEPTLEKLPLWRLLGMLDDAERHGDVPAARLLSRIVRQRLRTSEPAAGKGATHAS